MRITKGKLRKVIQEELMRILVEGDGESTEAAITAILSELPLPPPPAPDETQSGLAVDVAIDAHDAWVVEFKAVKAKLVELGFNEEEITYNEDREPVRTLNVGRDWTDLGEWVFTLEGNHVGELIEN
jgi:hypothetical protein